MLLKPAAVLFGVVFLLVGVLGFVPAAAPNQMLLGIFHVNAAHNGVHLLGLISNNMPDVWLHVAIAIAALVLGFAPLEPGSPERI